ncbi:hypothetical protein HPB50_013827 [Hyalomma asiaticum]|uniref:Uncharacterized protein n=1 Tax=Hyalomma asiaticum TaxID=266040 RepID=A0ACB7SY78_HYAAI|nr:hypothetical protein HPB50_013827 [Hyalomma asiaticum]
MRLDDSVMLASVFPVSLTAQAARWYRLVGFQARSMEEFRMLFRSEFLPPDYERRMRRELELRTQHPDESLLEYIRVLQELYLLADPMASDAEKVERAIRQAHPTFAAYLRSAHYRNLNDLASDAKRIQGDILAAQTYRQPPPPSASLESRCAWAGGDSSPRNPPKYEVASAAREQRDMQVLSDRALDPYSYARACSSFAPNGQRERDPSAPVHGGKSDRTAPLASERKTPSSRDMPSSPNVDKGVVCYRCHERGHLARSCSARRPARAASDLTVAGGSGSRRARSDWGEGEAVNDPQENRETAGPKPRHRYPSWQAGYAGGIPIFSCVTQSSSRALLHLVTSLLRFLQPAVPGHLCGGLAPASSPANTTSQPGFVAAGHSLSVAGRSTQALARGPSVVTPAPVPGCQLFRPAIPVSALHGNLGGCCTQIAATPRTFPAAYFSCPMNFKQAGSTNCAARPLCFVTADLGCEPSLVELTFEPEALRAIAHLAMERKTGARGLRAIMETILLEPMFEIPGSDVTSVHITHDCAMGKCAPLYIRGRPIERDFYDDSPTADQERAVSS